VSVLVIEDDRALRALLEAILRRNGISTRTVARGDDALSAILEGVHDAIILDLLLPGLSGVELLQVLRERQPHLLSRVIVITAVSAATLQSFEFGHLIWKLIRKPFEIDDLVATVLGCVACHAAGMSQDPAEFSRWFEKRSAPLNASTGVIAVVSDHALHLRADFGYAAGAATSAFPVPIDRNYPICAAFRLRKPVWIASLTLESAEYPLLLSIWTANGSQAIAALPLVHERQVLGTIGWSFEQPQAFKAAQRDALSQTASECLAILEHDSDAGRIVRSHS